MSHIINNGVMTSQLIKTGQVVQVGNSVYILHILYRVSQRVSHYQLIVLNRTEA